jgi:hypothetical protein
MKRLGTSFGSGEPQEPYPCLNLITLITYLFSLLLFVCLACPWASLYLRTLADTTLLHGCWLINKVVIQVSKAYTIRYHVSLPA